MKVDINIIECITCSLDRVMCFDGDDVGKAEVVRVEVVSGLETGECLDERPGHAAAGAGEGGLPCGC